MEKVEEKKNTTEVENTGKGNFIFSSDRTIKQNPKLQVAIIHCSQTVNSNMEPQATAEVVNPTLTTNHKTFNPLISPLCLWF